MSWVHRDRVRCHRIGIPYYFAAFRGHLDFRNCSVLQKKKKKKQTK